MHRSRIAWGVLSTAHIGQALVNPAIRASRNGTLHAVASRDAGRAAQFAIDGHFVSSHGRYEALLEDPAVDAVYIPLPNALHHPWTIRAAEHGKHVLCEKPLAMTAQECLEMTAAARANGVLLMEAFMYRFHPRTAQLVERVRAGAIGEPRVIRSAFTFRLQRPDNIRLSAELGGGALMDVGCYCVNVSRTLLGMEPVEVQAWARFGASGVDTELQGALRFPTGAVAQFDCALTLERREMVEVVGSEGSLSIEPAFLPDVGEALIHERKARTSSALVVPGVNQYQLMVEHFADVVLERRAGRVADVRYPGEEAAANMRVIEALYRSARERGRPVPVAP